MFCYDDPYEYLDDEGRPVRTMICSDGHTVKVHGNFDPWKYYGAVNAIVGEQYNMTIETTDVYRVTDGKRAPRPTAKKN